MGMNGCTIHHHTCSQLGTEHVLHLFLQKTKIGLLTDHPETVFIKINPTDHFIAVGFYIQLIGVTRPMEPEVGPLVINDVFKYPRAGFPETPGPVIGAFGILVYQENFFIGEPAAPDDVHGQAKTCTAGTCNDVVIWWGGSQIIITLGVSGPVPAWKKVDLHHYFRVHRLPGFLP